MVPNIWSERQLFAFSGIEGATDWDACFVASTVGHGARYGLRFHCKPERTLWIDGSALDPSEVRTDAVMSDFVRRDFVAADGEVRVEIAAGDKHSIFGRVSGSDALVDQVRVEVQADDCERSKGGEIESHVSETNRTFLMAQRWPGRLDFAFMYSPRAEPPGPIEIHPDFDRLVERKRHFVHACPECELPPDLKQTFLKACFVLKANVESAQPAIPCRWTTPDRVPHRYMWKWDSAFHAIGYRHLDFGLARDAILAVLHKQKDDGFIPHMMSPADDDDSDISQPPVLAWATWKTFEVSADTSFLKEAMPHLTACLQWHIANRRPTDKLLFHWVSGAESGMDNSPRFDSGRPFYAIDLAAYMAHECEHVCRFAETLREKAVAKYWAGVRQEIIDAINAELWDEERGFYFDRFVDGEFMDLKTEASFLPLLAGVASKEQAAKLVEHLTAPDEFWRPFPVPSVAADEPTYSDDMWRGPTWINYNHMIVRGLERYGYNDIANELKQRTLNEIARWYRELGCIFEFYDAEGATPPPGLDRKGCKQDPRRMCCIADYNWSAALFVDLIME